MKKNLQKMYDSKTLGVLLVVLLLFFGSNSMNAQAFSATWPFTSGTAASVTGDGSSNVTANEASYTTGTLGTVTFASTTTTTGFLNGTGISGRAATSCSSSYNSVGSTTPAAPYIEYKIVPNAGYKMTTDSFTFTVQQVTNVTNVVVAAGYSVNGGSSFTGLAAPTTSGSFTAPSANNSPTASNYGTSATAPATCAGTFTFTVPAATIAATNSFILRVVVWRNNASNSSSANLKISPPVITGTAEVSVEPVITAPTPGTLSNFNYIVGAGPSISKSFVVAGTNLTADLVVTPAADYEISSDNASFSTTPISLTPTEGTVAATTLYARLAAEKASGTYINRYMNITSTDAVTQSVVCSGFVTANYSYVGSGSLADVNNWGDASDGSGNHPLNFTTNYQYFTIKNTSAVATDVPWTVSGAGSRIIVGSPSLPAVALTITSGANIIGGPVDLSSANSGSNSLVVADATFLPANLGTLNAGSTLEFQASITSTLSTYGNNILVSGGTFSHTPSGGAANVTGNVTVTGGSFVLAGTSASTISGNVTVTGGEFKTNSSTITGNVTVSGTGIFNLNTGGSARTLTLNGNLDVSGTGGIVNSGVPSSSGSVQAFHINLSGTGKTIAYSASGSNLTKTNFYVIGSYALSGDLDYSSAGTTVFAAGQGLFTRQISVLSTGSLSLGAHTLKMGNALLNVTAPGTLTDEAATIVETTCAAYNAHDVLEVNEPTAQAAILPSRTWLGTVKYNYGTGAYGQKIVDGTYNNIVLNNAYGAELSGNTTVNGALTFTAGKITTGTNTLAIATSGSISGAGTGWVVGNLKKLTDVGSSPSYTYAIGDATNYTPLALTFSGNTSAAGSLTASTASGDHAQVASSGIDVTKSVNKTWTLTNDSLADFGTYSAAFGYSSADIDGTSTPANYLVAQYDGSTWSNGTVSGTPTDSATTAIGISGFGDFAIGECAPTTIGSETVSQCGGTYTWPVNNVTYSASETVVVSSGCNTATLNLTITAPTTTGSVTTSICEGGSYTWPANGEIYTTAQSGITVVEGCNTATLNLTVTPSSDNVTTVSANNSYTWTNTGETYTTSGIKTGTTTNCVTEKLNLTITTTEIPATFPAFCKGATIATATGSTSLKFYAALTGGTPLVSTTALTSKALFVTEMTNGQESTTRVSRTIVVNNLPATPSALTSTESALICKYIGSSTPVTFTATAAGTISSYIWTAPTGASVTNDGAQALISFENVSTTAGAIGAVTVKSVDTNGCVSLPKALALTTKVPTAPTSLIMTSDDSTPLFKGAAVVPATVPVTYTTVGLNTLTTGIKKVGPYIGTETVFTMTAPAAVTAASYLWTLPTGVNAIASSTVAISLLGVVTSTTPIITANFADVDPGTTALPIVVQSVGGCGNSTNRTLSLARALPTAPTALVLTNTSQANLSSLLKITKVGPYTDTDIPFTLTATPFTTQGAEATSYAWVLPAGVVCTSSYNTGVTPLTGSTVIATVPTPWTINDYITTTTSTITVKFSGVTGTGNLALSVYAVNGAGNSIARTLTLARALPTAPTKLELKDGATVLTNVGAYTAKITSLTLTATPFTTQGAEATSFNWVLPAGVNVTAGASLSTDNGTTKTWTGTASVLTINLAGISGPSMTSIPLNVYAVNGAGTSAAARTLTVTSAVPTAPTITAGAATFSTCATTTTTYTATAIPGATYTWTIPDGASIVGEENENVIVVDFTGATIAAAYAIKCIATNGTGPSLQKSLTIKKSTAACRLAPEGVTEAFKVMAYPNPATEGFRVKSGNGKSFGVQVYDMLGRSIEQRQMSSDAQIGSNYAKGVYNVIVNQGANVKTLRVIKR